jgi:hypothetical protein
MRPLGGSLVGAPSAVSSSPDRIDVFAVGSANTPWHWMFANGTWLPPVLLPSANNVPAEGLCAVASGPGTAEVFAVGTDKTPWWWRLNGGVVIGPSPLPAGANLPSVPLAAVASGPNSIDVFGVGPDKLVWWWRWNGANWSPPFPLPGGELPAERIAAISAIPGRLDVFGVVGSTHLSHWWMTMSPVWNVQDLGGSLPSEGVSAVSWGPGRIDIFGVAGSTHLSHWWWDGNTFGGPEDLGGSIVAGTVSAVSRSPNRLDVFGISGDQRLARWQWDGYHWSGPTFLGENVPAGDVSAVARGSSRVDVFIRGADNTLRQWPGSGVEYITHEPWTNLNMNWQVPSVNNNSPIAPVPPLGQLAAHCHPDGLDDLVALVQDAERQGRRVRAVGSSWSISDVAVTGDYLIETNKLNREIAGVVNPDVLTVPLTNLLHFEAGITIVDLIKILDSRNLAMPTLGGSSGQTLAGVLSTSVHGTDFDRGPIPEVVRAIHLVGPGGVQHWIEPTMSITNRDALRNVLGLDDANIHYDDEWFNAALVSMGCFGIIYSVIIEVVPQFDLVETCEPLTYTAARAKLMQGAAGNPFDVPGNMAVNLIVNPFLAADGTRPCFLITRKTAAATAPAAAGGPPAWFLQFAAPGLIASFQANPNSIDAFVTWQTRSMYPATVPGQEKRGWAHTMTTSADPPPVRGLALEIAFDATNDDYLNFMDAACDILANAYQNDHLGLAGWFSMRYVGQSRAFMSQFGGRSRTCTAEFAGLEQLDDTRVILSRLEAAGRQFGGIQHWGMFDDLTADDVQRAYPALDRWLAVRSLLTNNGMIHTFDNGFSERCGLAAATPPVPVEMAAPRNSIALVRQTTGWSTIPVALSKANAPWEVTNGAAPQFIDQWSSTPGVRVIAGDFNGDGRTDFALVRQTPGWGSIPVAFSNGDGTWKITNGAAPQFLDDWANQPGVRVVAGDFNGDGKTDLALVRQTPGWNTIPIAFSNGDGTWKITNGAAPQFIGDWANQSGVTVIAGDFNGNHRTDLALVRQTPGWNTIPVAFSNGDGTWNITNSVASPFIDQWSYAAGVRVVAGDFNGDGKTDIALVRQMPGWGSIPIAFSNGDGTWNITNGAAPQFIDQWAYQAGVRVIAGDFNGDGKTDIALVRQTPGWGSIPIAFSNGDGTWKITNGAAPQFIDLWSFQPGVQVVAGNFNGDSKTDIALVRQTQGWGTIPVAVSNGDGSWDIVNAAASPFIDQWSYQPGVRAIPVTRLIKAFPVGPVGPKG